MEILHPGHERTKTANIAGPVQAFIDKLEPAPGVTYALVSAMSYSEYFGPNSNTDWYGHNKHLNFNGLLHQWPEFGREPELDAIKGRNWPHGYPCFYAATAYAHHRNTDPKSLGFGDVVFVYANPHMKRIELVIRIFNDEAEKKGHRSIIDRIERNERVDVSMGAKIPFDACVRPDQLLRTPVGWRPAAELRVGDRVLTHRGRYRRITRRFDRRVAQDLYRIRASGTVPVHVTGNHPMYVVREDTLRCCKGSVGGKRRRCTPDTSGQCSFCGASLVVTPVWLDADQVRLGDYLVAPRGAVGTETVDPDYARLLGYWVGDGHRLRERRNADRSGEHYLTGFGITAGTSEGPHLQKVIETIERVATAIPRVYDQGNGKKAVGIYTHDRVLAARLLRHGATDGYEKALHNEIFSWAPDAQRHLLGGWIDTDGHFDPVSGAVRISTSVRGLALDAQRLLRAQGIPGGLLENPSPGGFVGSKPSYTILISPDHVRELCLWEVSLKVPRPRARLRKGGSRALIIGDHVLHPVTDIGVIDYRGSVVNFSVQGDETYVVEGITTHNCSVCTDWDRVRDAMTRFDPAKHRHHMMPVLEEHKRHAIRGIAETRKQYCACMRTMAGRVNDDGQLVFVYNDAPRFFDISFVLIGADRTSRVMWHLPSLRGERPAQMPPGMILDSMGTPMSGLKIASMDKDSPGVAVNALDAAHHGYDFSGVMAACRSHKPKSVLASLAALGIIASPREFSALLTGAPTDFDTQVSGADRTFEPRGADVQDSLVKAFAPLVEPRSSFAACQTAERPEGGRERICVVVAAPDLARKYAGYRLGLIKHAGELFSHGQDPVKIAAQGPGLLLGRPGVIQWFSSHVVPDLGSASVETITKLSSMIRTTQDLMKVGNALDGVLRVSNTSSLWTAVEDVAEATCYL